MSSHCQVLRVLGTKGRDLPLRGHVGLECLPDQLAKKCVKRGFDFNILCIGETGIGKSTLIDSLFKTNFHDVPATHKQPKVTLSEHTYELQESSVHLRLRVVSTAGYGDQINTENSCRTMLEHIDRQFESYLQEELKVKRDMISFHDTRIHACLFLLSPTGLPIKTLDLACMKELHKKVNIIPVIAKADTISRSELPQFKARIIEELQSNGVQIYQFPTDDETVADINARMNDQLPFAVVGSQEEIVVRGRRVRARQYPWGILEIENDAHCDFIKLREMLLCTNMEDLREKTHTTHYEVYRRNRLLEMRVLKQLQESGQLQQFEQLHGPVAEDNLLKEFELLQRQIAEENQQLDDERKQLEEQKRQLEDKKRQLEEGIKKKAVQGEATATQALRGEDDLETRMGSNFNRGIQPVH